MATGQMDLFKQPNMRMEPKWNVIEMVFNWLDAQPVGRKFGPKEIQNHIEDITDRERQPQDGTITRYIREYNAQGGSILNVDRAKSQYMKEKHRRLP